MAILATGCAPDIIYSVHVYDLRLENNYHYEDGVCLPRSAIYEHYLDFCQRAQIRPVNAASYGKVRIYVHVCMYVCTCTYLSIGKYGSTSYIGMTRKKNGGQ